MTRLVSTRADLAAARDELAGPVAVVMTMGALHEGHAELVRHAAKHARSVIVTIFVNPLQFGDANDLAKYPRQLAADVTLCQELGVDLVFAPSVDEVYPSGTPAITVSAGALATRFEGVDRPGHFDGVLTVVNKLLNLTKPDIAVFGEKDAQQLALITSMVRDLDMGVEIVPVPTVREADGLALSSRNQRLSASDRRTAKALPRALAAGLAHAPLGAAAVLSATRTSLESDPSVDVAYVALVDADSWSDADATTTEARLLIAARVGGVRLIDNQTLCLAASIHSTAADRVTHPATEPATTDPVTAAA